MQLLFGSFSTRESKVMMKVFLFLTFYIRKAFDNANHKPVEIKVDYLMNGEYILFMKSNELSLLRKV